MSALVQGAARDIEARLFELIPIGAGQSNTYMTMVADFQNSGGVDNFLTISQFLTPVFA